MSPNERYQKFLANDRKVTKFYIDLTHDMEIARQGMYRLRQRYKETFEISCRNGIMVISDNPFKREKRNDSHGRS